MISSSRPTALALLASSLLGVAKADVPRAEDLTAQLKPGEIIIHYHRFDGEYITPGLWTWDGRKEKDPSVPEVLATGESDFGVYFILNVDQFGPDDGPNERIGFIPRMRRDWNHKDGTDRFWTPELGPALWLVANDPRTYTTRPDVSPAIAAASVDGPRLMVLRLTHPVKLDALTPDSATVTDVQGAPVAISSVLALRPENDKTSFVELQFPADLNFLQSTYTASLTGFRPGESKLRRVLDDRSIFHTTDPMGATYTPEKTTFRLFSPLATEVTLVLFDESTGDKGRTEVPMTRRKDGVWEVVREGDLEGKHYRLKVATRYGVREVNDPVATNTTGDKGHARITNLRALDPAGFRPIVRPVYGTEPTDAIIYQLHIRDFTIHETSGVKEEVRGEYLGLAQAETSLPGKPHISTAIAHLKQLGVTHVQIQPFHDFDNDEANPDYNWGYMTAFFNSPEGSFSSDFRGTARVKETKQMIAAIKNAGIGVILDVVYNHTGTQNTLEAVAPGYYHRLREDGSFYNGSGTGNEVRSEAPMARQFIIDSLKLWLDEYGVDGFRFDLMGLIDLATLQEVKRELQALYPEVLLYGEPWAATGPDGTGIDRIVYKDVVRGSGLSAFNDHFRDAIKGSPDGSDAGYVVNGERRDGVIRGIEGSINDWAEHPFESINYADVHDNLILYDKLKYSAAEASAEDRKKMQALSAGILAVSQGIMLLHSGSDFLRTKQGNHNSYNAGDDINAVRWNLKADHIDNVEWVAGLIALRKAHPIFRLPTRELVTERLSFVNDNLPAPEVIHFVLAAKELEGETWSNVEVFINPTAQPLDFKLVDQTTAHLVFAHDGKAGLEPQQEVTGQITVPARSLSIAAR
jgi:pullulanase